MGSYFMKLPVGNARRMARRLRTTAILLGVCLCGGEIVRGCNVPVFRYALERWQPDVYRVTLFHRGPLTESQKTVLHSLEEPSGKAVGNTSLRVVDVAEIEEDADRTLHADHAELELPWLAVQYPQSLRNDKAVWAGPLAKETVARLVFSPLRTELIRRLADGQTAVWLILESGQADKDNAVAQRLSDDLKELTEKLKLPELGAAPDDKLLSDAPLHVKFSVLRVPRNVAAEEPLVKMLLGSEPDLAALDEPMVFPIFGRGRALLPLVGAGITGDNIHESAGFLVGACSCEIKELNPGFDLLLAADWDVLLFKEAPSADAPVAPAKVPAGKAELVAIPDGSQSAAPASTPSEANLATWSFTNYGAGLALVGLLLVVVVVAFKRFA